mgnify:CR=1 FL=1
MPKTYTDELAEWVRAREAKKPRQDKYVVAFLAVKSDVQAALEAGYAMKTIWEHMKEIGRLSCRYETFTQHVKRYIKEAAPAPTHSTAAEQAKGEAPEQQQGEAKARKPKAAEPKKTEPAGIAGFHFNPKPNKEDLL